MKIGIMHGTIRRPGPEEILDAVVSYGLDCMQFDLDICGLPTLPEQIDHRLAEEISRAFERRNLKMAALSGHFNMIHPDLKQREVGLRNLGVLAAACDQLGTAVITLCTGTRDPNNMWRNHPDNSSAGAWSDLLKAMQTAIEAAEAHGVTLAFEPEVSNVVDSAKKARQLLDEMKSSRLKAVMDGANIFQSGALPRMREVLDEAFDLLGPDIVLAHAKDLDRDGEAGHLAAGKGLLDYGHYLARLDQLANDVPLILHGLSEAELPGSLAFIHNNLPQ